jgi:hypothetical protein
VITSNINKVKDIIIFKIIIAAESEIVKNSKYAVNSIIHLYLHFKKRYKGYYKRKARGSYKIS